MFMPSSTPTSMRFTADERELLDSWASYLASEGYSSSTSDVIRQLMHRATPPEGPSPERQRTRIAYKRLFGSRTGPT